MDLGIQGKKAIVAGGSGGLGKGSARALAREGVEVFIVARSEPRLSRTTEEIAAETGASVTAVQADHSTLEGRAKILAACPDPDILVTTCTPPAMTGDYQAIDVEHWRQTFDLTLLAPIELMRALIPGMVERGFGRVVNIGTGAAKNPQEVRLLSGAPRAALVNYSVAVSKAVARHNVIVNCLLPGMFHTDSMQDIFSKRADENGTSYEAETRAFAEEWRIPTRNFGNPDDLGAICAIFCSKYVSNVVGQSLLLDGGLTNTTF